MIHLDTSFLIRALIRGTPEDLALRRWIKAGESLAISTVAWAEFRCGPLQQLELAAAAAIVDRHREFTRDDAETAARLYNESGRRRGSLMDCMIAAVALADGAAVATSNTPDFQRLGELGVTLAR